MPQYMKQMKVYHLQHHWKVSSTGRWKLLKVHANRASPVTDTLPFVPPTRSPTQNYELGFGVTSKLWDHVFGTTLPESRT